MPGRGAALGWGPLAGVAEWQTRWIQNPLLETEWGFKSPLRHCSRIRVRPGPQAARAAAPFEIP